MNSIYIITNTVSGKVYVGRTVNAPQRRGTHFSALQRGMHPNGELQSDYNEHGKDHFEFSILEEDAPTSDEALWIAAFPDVYNLYMNTRIPTRVFSDERRQQMSALRKGIRFTEEHKARISAGKKLYEARKRMAR